MSEAAQITLISALGTLVGGLIVYFASRKVNKASALKLMTESTVKLIKPLNDRIDDLESATAKLIADNRKQKKQITKFWCALRAYADRISYLMQGIKVLITQLLDNDHTPEFFPDEWLAPEVSEYDENTR